MSIPTARPPRVLFSQAQIATRVSALGAQLAAEYAAKRPLVLGTLTGAFAFTADLVRAMHPPPPGLNIDFVRAESYKGTSASGLPRISLSASKIPVAERHVVLVEDIVDTGSTAAALEAEILAQGAASVAVVTLLDKPAGRARSLSEAGRAYRPAHVGFTVGDEFVVGYGLDRDEEDRGWGYVGVIDP